MRNERLRPLASNRAAVVLMAAVLLASLPLGTAGAAGTPEDMLKEAQQLEQGGTLQRAVTLYQDFLKKYADHSQVTEVHYRLAKCFDNMGMVDETLAELKTVAESGAKTFRNRPDALYMLGKLYGTLKDYDNAIATFEKMLSEGAGLYEDDVLNLTGGYYALKEKYTDAAAKLNILKRKTESKLAQQASYKLAQLWIKAGELEMAVEAIQDFAQAYAKDPRIPELLLRAADSFRQQKKFDKTIALAEQLKSAYPGTMEAAGAGYLLGLCYRDRKDFNKAVQALDQVGAGRDAGTRAIAAEAMLQSAETWFADLGDPAKAMVRYQEAARIARDSDSDRRQAIMEQAFFRIAEHHFAQRNWSVALEHYLLIRGLGSKLNVTGRILKCQAELDSGRQDPRFNTDADLTVIKEKIAANPGTAIAAEAEIFLADRKLADAMQRRTAALTDIASEYEKILGRYSKEVLTTDHLESYVYSQMGQALARSELKAEWQRALGAFEKAIAVDPGDANPYKVPGLENIVLLAQRLGDKEKERKAALELFNLTKQKLDEKKDDKELETKTLAYLKTLVVQTTTKDLINESIALCRKLIEEKGQLSDLSRDAWFYMAELHYLSKDFSQAAKTFKDFIQIYGPKQNEEGDFRDGPWKPAAGDPRAAQIYDASLRIAHCWFMQGHQINMAAAYRWIVRNVPHENPAMAEAQYWLAMELGKGKKGESKEGRRQLAEALWTNVVHKSLDFEDPNFTKLYHPWADGRWPQATKYVKTAMLKAAQVYGYDLSQHEVAAKILDQYVNRYPMAPRERRQAHEQYDEQYDTARYALGREYSALKQIPKLIACYGLYLNDLRESRFRVSALKLLGSNAGQEGQYAAAIEAYATLLDEYGVNPLDANGNIVPVPAQERLRRRSNWDGVRMPVPKDLDQGEIRYNLGFIYWKQEQWGECIKALAPFLSDPALAKNKSRGESLFMIGQSYYRLYDYGNGARVLHALIREYPKFEAVEEAYVYAARGMVETKAWADLDVIYRQFISDWTRSDKRPRMDLYSALSRVAQGQSDKGLSNLKSLASGDTYEDVKADAAYYLGLHYASAKPPSPEEAALWFEKSVATYPRETACLAGAKHYIGMQRWAKAQELLDRAIREFPRGNQTVVNEARTLMPGVLAELAKQQSKQKK